MTNNQILKMVKIIYFKWPSFQILELVDISNFRIGRQVKFLSLSTDEILKSPDNGTVHFI